MRKQDTRKDSNGGRNDPFEEGMNCPKDVIERQYKLRIPKDALAPNTTGRHSAHLRPPALSRKEPSTSNWTQELPIVEAVGKRKMQRRL